MQNDQLLTTILIVAVIIVVAYFAYTAALAASDRRRGWDRRRWGRRFRAPREQSWGETPVHVAVPGPSWGGGAWAMPAMPRHPFWRRHHF